MKNTQQFKGNIFLPKTNTIVCSHKSYSTPHIGSRKQTKMPKPSSSCESGRRSYKGRVLGAARHARSSRAGLGANSLRGQRSDMWQLKVDLKSTTQNCIQTLQLNYQHKKYLHIENYQIPKEIKFVGKRCRTKSFNVVKIL